MEENEKRYILLILHEKDKHYSEQGKEEEYQCELISQFSGLKVIKYFIIVNIWKYILKVELPLQTYFKIYCGSINLL